jgi:hypothetical protein
MRQSHICGLLHEAFSSCDYIQLNVKGLVNDELERIWKAVVCCLNSCLEEMRKATKCPLGLRVSRSKPAHCTSTLHHTMLFSYVYLMTLSTVHFTQRRMRR